MGLAVRYFILFHIICIFKIFVLYYKFKEFVTILLFSLLVREYLLIFSLLERKYSP